MSVTDKIMPANSEEILVIRRVMKKWNIVIPLWYWVISLSSKI